MADSDDEYDRRRRDKFRRERSDYDRSRERDERRRDDWSDREWDRGRERRSREYRDYDRSRRERFSPPRHDMSPPQKRMRRDCGYDMPYSGTSGGPAYGPPQPWGHPDMHVMQHPGIPIQARLGNLHDVDLGTPTPVMKTFKEFLLSLEDTVDETEAVRRYNEYKLEFRRQQMQDFFLAHKDEEWYEACLYLPCPLFLLQSPLFCLYLSCRCHSSSFSLLKGPCHQEIIAGKGRLTSESHRDAVLGPVQGDVRNILKPAADGPPSVFFLFNAVQETRTGRVFPASCSGVYKP